MSSLFRFIRCWPIVLALSLCIPSSSTAIAADWTAASITDRDIAQAIQALRNRLYSLRDPVHQWDTPGSTSSQRGGYTALATLALLESGERGQTPALDEALQWLAAYEFAPGGCYARAIRTCVWAKLPEYFRPLLERDAVWMMDHMHPEQATWHYSPSPGTFRDNSTRQYGALALWEAAMRGVPVPPQYWRRIEDELVRFQNEDGGWSYKSWGKGERNDSNGNPLDPDPSIGSMTVAGLATLLITQEYLHGNAAVNLELSSMATNRAAVAGALNWLDQHYTPHTNPFRSGNNYYHYYAYGVERVGLASGRRRFNDLDWFRTLAARLLNLGFRQTSSGELESTSKSISNLSFDLLFFSRGGVPVAVNKLHLGPGTDNRPRDVANLVTSISNRIEQSVSWQLIDGNSPIEDWMSSAFLYVSGTGGDHFYQGEPINPVSFQKDWRRWYEHAALVAVDRANPDPSIQKPTFEDSPLLRRLQQYLDHGGLLFACSDRNDRAFLDSVQQAGTLLYPQYDWIMLPDDHWIYSLHTPIRGARPRFRSLSNGVRELIIIGLREDYSAAFQKRDTRAENLWDALLHVYLHATQFNRPSHRLAQPALIPEIQTRAPGAADRTIIRAIRQGNWNPEPAALALFKSWYESQGETSLRIIDVPLERIHRGAVDADLVLVSGTGMEELTEWEKDALLEWQHEKNGIMLFQTAGGMGEFARNAQRTVASLSGTEAGLVGLHPSFSASSDDLGPAVSRVQYTYYTDRIMGRRERNLRLQVLSPETPRPRFFFSGEDLEHALLSRGAWNVHGYRTDSAREILARLIAVGSQTTR